MDSSPGFGHFCPAAQALALVGERWSLLIVRDLLDGEQRFTDLQRTLGRITPKLLTRRLRELEDHGIVERDTQPGRREVYYRLSERGRALGPVVDALMVWGAAHAARIPEPGEPVGPSHLMRGLSASLNAAGVRLPDCRAWTFRFVPGGPYALRFDGRDWTAAPGEGDGGAELETSPDALARVLMTKRGRRRFPAAGMSLRGEPLQVEELRALVQPR